MTGNKRFWGLVGRWYRGVALLTIFLSACALVPPQQNNGSGSSAFFLPETPALTEKAVRSQATQALDDCLVGSWAVADLEQSLAESYARVQSPLALKSIEGETQYIFGSDGSLEIRFDNLVTTLSGEIEGKDIQARNLMVGTATALYRLNVQNREIVFSNFGGDGIEFSMEINGQVLAQGDFPAWRAFSTNLTGSSLGIPTAGPTRVVEESYASVSCAGDEMRLQAMDPVPGPEVHLKRIP